METNSNPFSGLNTAQLAEAALSHWAQLNSVLPVLDEKQVESLLVWELYHRRNPAIVRRLHQRVSSLRTTREREWLLASINLGTHLSACTSEWEVRDILRQESVIQS